MVVRLIILLICCISVNTRYLFYQSDISQTSSSSPIFDCLYAHLIDAGKEIGSRYIQNDHLIPYCRRPDDDDKKGYYQQPINENSAPTITFAELKKHGITSEQLLEWYVPMDVAERYEMSQNDWEFFHNCSSPWFGSMCQYRFEDDSSLPFHRIVEATFENYSIIIRHTASGTCYRFLNNCTQSSWPLCLDWREICDGKIDCIAGEDEQWCDQLEMTTCTGNEYRCHYGGQCIPAAFVKDSSLSMDCLDGSDEKDDFTKYRPLVNVGCTDVQTFRCQERIGRYPRSFQCGDGQYIIDFQLPSRITSCSNRRDIEYSRAILTSLNHISNRDCRQAFLCALYANRTEEKDQFQPVDTGKMMPVIDKIWDEDCEPLSQHCSTKWLSIPEYPMLSGFFQLIYFTNRSPDDFKARVAPDFICFDELKCPALLVNLVTTKVIDGLTCANTANLIEGLEYLDFDQLLSHFVSLSRRCLMEGSEKSCVNSSYFHCNQSSRCISPHRVGDGTSDCYCGEDEQSDTCHMNDSNRFFCESDPNVCLRPVAVGNGVPDCPAAEDELYIYTRDLVRIIPFSVLCDRFENYEMILPNIPETDETNCEWWPCTNVYTHCDGIWHCPHGADELNCPQNPCSTNEHQCHNDWLGLSYCLPIHRIFYKHMDDWNGSLYSHQLYFYNGTGNIGQEYSPWNETQQYQWIFTSNVQLLDSNETLCRFDYQPSMLDTRVNRFLRVVRFGNFPSFPTNRTLSIIPAQHNQTHNNIPNIDVTLISYCHRGIAVLTHSNEGKVCLCPPNYFGDRCQWQTQRVSLTVQFIWRSTASISVIFQAIIMLMDDDGQIAPNFERIIYMPSRDCDTKFNLYLLYPDRPKNQSKNYFIRIDLFDKTNLQYWASWSLPIPFLFLPVNRIATQLFIPEIRQIRTCSYPCGKHGQCVRYINTDPSFFFCRCHPGYSGIRCDIPYRCPCSPDSFCLDPSICVCPLHKYGRYCYLKHSICQSSTNPCQHNGLCVPNDDRISSKGFTCFCTDDYSGPRCENQNNRIDIYLNDTSVQDASLVLIHLITAFPNAEHQRITLLKRIPFNQPILTLHISQSFHILFLQIPDQYYYLAILREIYIPSESISTAIQSQQRCLPIDQLNKTLSNSTYLHRTKFYSLLCQDTLHLLCFYDQDVMCICNLDRFSNCFSFNHSTNYDCQGSYHCENGGQCFQNNQTCPTKSTCICPDCYYGTKCQFSTKGFLFSLDPILAYHIKPHISLNQQPLIIKISIAINIIMFILGSISCSLSIIVFHRKKSRQVGSGNYLLASSITSLCMNIILTLEFWDLILSQMSVITNRTWLIISCKFIDYLLKVLLASSEWLNACVAMERMMSVIKGANFSQTKSRKYSKWVIVGVFILTILTQIQDPIYRQLIDDSDADEQRIWCFVQYSDSVRFYNTFIILLHFLLPFSIHFLTALRIIKKVALRRAIVQPEQTYQTHLQQQFHRHQHLLFAPLMLVLLSLPRLIISFFKGCMRSAREPWFYLIGYFVSFIPAMLTFVVFALPSKHHKKELNQIFLQMIRRVRNMF